MSEGVSYNSNIGVTPEVIERYPLDHVQEELDQLPPYPSPFPVIKGTTVLRTSKKYDELVRHLGYEPVDISEYPGMATDIDLIEDSQRRLSKVRVINESKLTPTQKCSLKLVQAIDHRIRPAIIPPASDLVSTAGLYNRVSRDIYISIDQLNRGQAAVDTAIHEVAHRTSGAEDGEEAHSAEMKRIAGAVLTLVQSKEYDSIIKVPDFRW